MYELNPKGIVKIYPRLITKRHYILSLKKIIFFKLIIIANRRIRVRNSLYTTYGKLSFIAAVILCV